MQQARNIYLKLHSIYLDVDSRYAGNMASLFNSLKLTF